MAAGDEVLGGPHDRVRDTVDVGRERLGHDGDPHAFTVVVAAKVQETST
ncbi:hypothetical protein ACFFMR_07095 [Micromonospora andamanensis]|nr:hypothetical protein [Micromonospora andamanensis]